MSDASQAALQPDLHRLDQWTINWGMSFNEMKYHVTQLGDHNPTYSYSLGAHNLSAIDLLDNLGLSREAASPC